MRDTRQARPLVTIIVPSFNQGRFIAATLRSCLEQDYRPLEILVMDGGSTDETLERLGGFDDTEVVVRSEPDGGVVDAVNKGLAAARGSILTIQSSDDLFLPGAVSAAVDAFHEQSHLGLVYGDIEYIDADSRVVGVDDQGPFDLAEYLGRLQYVPQPGTFFNRAVLDGVKGWRSDFSYCADADFWIRIARHWPVLKLRRRVAQYRYHDAQRDVHRDRLARDWSAMVEALIREPDFPPRLKRFARMGRHLARYRYAPPGAWWLRTTELYRAAAVNPPSVLHPRFPRRELLPGREPIWRLLSRFKRALGLRPR